VEKHVEGSKKEKRRVEAEASIEKKALDMHFEKKKKGKHENEV
jgi:hypothetical protein